MRKIIDMSEPIKLTLFPETTEQEIVQNIYCSVRTILGSAPLHRAYGLDMAFLHLPVSGARSRLVSAVAQTIERCEPRARLERIRFGETSDSSHLKIALEVTCLE